MPRGQIPEIYFDTPRVDKPLEEIYQDIEGLVYEFFPDEQSLHSGIDFWVQLPPLQYRGRFLKGIFFTQAADLLLDRYPFIQQLFFTISNSMCSAFSRSQKADALFYLYDNPHRADWFRKTYPERARMTLLPLSDCDFTNEYAVAPPFDKSKETDVLCVARIARCKNMPLICRALKIHRQKYYPIRMTWVVGAEFDMNWNGLDEQEKSILREVEDVLGHTADYIQFRPSVRYSEMPGIYARSRALVLGSLLEGKNRALSEAMCCDTPVICFKDFNSYTRGETPIFPQGAGLTCDFDPESLADAIHTVLENPTEFEPRGAYLRERGRRKFFDLCLDSLPYYRQNLEGYQPGSHHLNPWLDLAVQDNYQLGLHDFIYDRNPLICHQKGLEAIDPMVTFYGRRFHLI